MKKRGLILWMVIAVTMLLAACSKDDEPKTLLDIYVYGPAQQQSTRAGEDEVDASADENRLTTLQIWVFEHTDAAALVGYISPTTMPTADGTTPMVYQMAVSNQFANYTTATRPTVDVYVLANAANAGLSYGENTSKATLEAAILGNNKFGYTSPQQTTVPDGGLPMSGVLRQKTVVGENPVLRIGTEAQMAEVILKRLVSKVYFVFCQSTSAATAAPMAITKIEIDGEMLPDEESVFLDDGGNYKIGNAYNASAVELSGSEITTVKTSDNMLQYVYTNQNLQTYETLINTGISNNELSEAGPYYLHETDKLLSGKIYYKIGGVERTPATFAISTGGNFWRNHSWIVYGYQGGDNIKLCVVRLKDWETIDPSGRNVYNW